MEEKKAEMQDKRQELFCTRFAETAAKIGENVLERRGNVKDRIENRAGRLDDSRDSRDAKLGDKRSDTDQKRSEMYAKLEAKADTDAKKEAVKDFKSTVEKAVDTRQATIDTAITTYRTAVDARLAGRQDEMQSAVNKFDRSPVYAKKYEEGDKSPQLILDYIKALNAANKSSLKVANDYLNENKTGSSDIHYKIIYEAATSSDSKPFDQLIANEKKIVKIYSQQDFNKRKYAALIASVRKSIEYESPDLLASAQETAKKEKEKD